jgi:hypothetical protein
MCRHEFMIYNKESMSNIANECYSQGKCKFCFQDLVAYHEKIKENLSTKSYMLIYTLISLIGTNMDEIRLFSFFYNTVYDEIERTKRELNESEEMALTSVCLYKFYILTKNVIHFKVAVKGFLYQIKEFYTKIGWSEQVVQNIISDDKFFAGMIDIKNKIKNYIFDSIRIYPEYMPVSILFEKMYEPDMKLTPKTKTQELYMSQELTKFNKIYFDSRKQQYFKLMKYIKKIVNINTKKRLMNVELDIKDDKDFQFLKNVWYYYCPVNFTHNYVKNICEFCGIQSDGNNIEEIFKKHKSKITNLYTPSISTIVIPPVKNTVMSEIEKTKPTFLSESNTLNEKIKEEITNNEGTVLDFIKNNINAPDFIVPENVNEFIYKGLTYLNKIGFTEEDLMGELLNLLFPVENILNFI